MTRKAQRANQNDRARGSSTRIRARATLATELEALPAPRLEFAARLAARVVDAAHCAPVGAVEVYARAVVGRRERALAEVALDGSVGELSPALASPADQIGRRHEDATVRRFEAARAARDAVEDLAGFGIDERESFCDEVGIERK